MFVVESCRYCWVLICALDCGLMHCKAACCDPSQQLPSLAQLLLLLLAKQQAADNATHTNSGGTAMGKLHMHLYNVFVLTMKSTHLGLNCWLFTMFLASQSAVLAPKTGRQNWVYGSGENWGFIWLEAWPYGLQ